MVFTKIGDEISKLWYHTNRRRFLNFVKSGKLLFSRDSFYRWNGRLDK